MSIKERYQKIRREIPEYVTIVAAAKTRTAKEILEAIEAGIEIIGENYVQEAEKVWREIGGRAKWHFIGHLQRNKVKKAVKIFDMIQTVDSLQLAEEIEKRCSQIDKIMPILIEINIAKEETKTGVNPEEAKKLIRAISAFSHLKIKGLMTMGPQLGNPEEARPYFTATRKIFQDIKRKKIPHVDMEILSMGMSNSFRVAIEEGANMVRLGTVLFGPREEK